MNRLGGHRAADGTKYDLERRPETRRGSIEVSSEFHPQLSARYDEVFEEWYWRKSRELTKGTPTVVAVN